MADYETYRTTAEERAKGKWAVVAEKLDEDGLPDAAFPIHIIPTYGIHHLIHKDCWCVPKPDPELFNVWVHGPSH